MLDFEVKNAPDLASLGDGFVNLVYSLALSNALKKPTGKKVSNYVLAEALIRSGLRERAGSRLDRHGMADYVERFIFQGWIKKTITLEECTDILTKSLRSNKSLELREASIEAFSELLKYIAEGKMKQILVTVDAIVEKDSKILLIERKNEPFKGCWALPGGFIEYGESAEEAVKREIKEEANLDIKIKRLLGVYSTFGRDPRGHIVSICYVAEGEGEEKGGSDAGAARFFSLNEIKKQKLAFDHAKIIEDYIKGK